ncbi:MAG: butyrate kinase [Bacteroidetes bacterium]|nr:MAG: butyrate kinase [Bacteroidota bacterium]PIE87823.1 MAG: butyrate kinase [Bacteroidota bacterium]
MKVLAINPGSTSTKIAVYEDKKEHFIKTLRHTAEELKDFEKITDEFSFRKNIIIQELKDAGIDLNTLDAIIGRGGLIKPIPSGIYEVNDAMKADLIDSPLGEHASNLGGLIADDIAKELSGKVKAYIVDPVVVDELQDVARVSGHPLFERLSIFHALNQKAVARTHAEKVGKKYEEMNLIVAHLGGGISVGAHEKGQVIDVNNALDGEGPLSPERSGSLPTGQLVNICFSKKYTKKEVKAMLKGKGGLMAHCGTNSAYEVQKKAEEGDPKAILVQNAMAYQIAKACGAMATALKGKVDAIILTGGIAHNKILTAYVKERVEFIAPLAVYPGEDEMGALAMNGLLVLNGEIEPKVYHG